MITKNENISFYFNMKSWTQIFTEDDLENVKVPMCGNMDFSPVQHAQFIKWHEGVNILKKYNIGCVLGLGL